MSGAPLVSFGAGRKILGTTVPKHLTFSFPEKKKISKKKRIQHHFAIVRKQLNMPDWTPLASNNDARGYFFLEKKKISKKKRFSGNLAENRNFRCRNTPKNTPRSAETLKNRTPKDPTPFSSFPKISYKKHLLTFRKSDII